MRILITGSGGFVGRRLSTVLASRGHEVTGTYLREAPSLSGIKLIDCDLMNAALLREAVARVAPEAIIHLAGLSHVGESWRCPNEYFRVNFLGTELLLEAAGEAPVVMMSSAEVYGRVPEQEQPIKEERATNPRSPYALSKAAGERASLRQKATVIRLFNVVGAGQATTFALPSFAAQLAKIEATGSEPVLKVGDLSPRRDFVHLDDAVEAIELVTVMGQPGRTYNIGTGQANSISEALNLLIAASGITVEIEVDPKRLRPVDLPLLCADNSRLRELGWTPSRGLGEALNEVWVEARAQAVGP